MRIPTAWSMIVVAPFTILFAGCRDEVAVTLDEIETVQQEILALLEQQAQTTAVPAAAADTAVESARTALENTGLVWEDSSLGGVWRGETGAIPCSDTFTTPGTPFCDEWREARREARRANSRHEDDQRAVNNRTSRFTRDLDALRRAHEDDTWDAFALTRTGNSDVSARSIVVTYLRELEDERTRLENLVAESHP